MTDQSDRIESQVRDRVSSGHKLRRYMYIRHGQTTIKRVGGRPKRGQREAFTDFETPAPPGSMHRTLLLVAALAAAAAPDAATTGAQPFEQILAVPTKGAAGWKHFRVADQDYLVVANFFTSRPEVQPSMKTDSVVYKATLDQRTRRLKLEEVQRFETVGAHGVDVFDRGGRTYMAVPNYYGGDTVILRWDDDGEFEEMQRLRSDGGGSVEAFSSGALQLLAIAEFNVGVAALYVLRGEYPNERFEPWQRVRAPGVGAVSSLMIPGEGLFLFAASYVTRETGWRTRSPVFKLNTAGSAFEPHSSVPTVGAHDVEALSVAGRHFVFFSNDKDETSTHQPSELFEWGTLAGGGGRGLVSRQRIQTDGAHAAELFSDVGGSRHFLAIANLGDRGTGKYRRDSAVYTLDVTARDGQDLLTLVQPLPTLGATDFTAFVIQGQIFLAASEEQDDVRGGDVESKIWVLRPEPDGHKPEGNTEL